MQKILNRKLIIYVPVGAIVLVSLLAALWIYLFPGQSILGIPVQQPTTVSTPELLKGHLLGTLDNNDRLSIGEGINPCAKDENHARELLKQFFGAIEHETAPRYYFESVGQAKITKSEKIFKVQFLNDPDFVHESGDSYGRTWYVLNCNYIKYISWGMPPPSAYIKYPYDDIADEHLQTYPTSLIGKSHKYLKKEYVVSLEVARLEKKISTLEEFEDFVNFLYQIGYFPLSGFNQSGKIEERKKTAEANKFIIEDTVLWKTFNDVPPFQTTTRKFTNTISLDRQTQLVGAGKQ
ncbi:MAG: hypothetical protein A2Z24_02175 [Candidatus Woykebacteria bacterium RBG_16_44_10]|uniref:Uncharacterized protein n=1 Tax=Candidatus Woykebacteria bacterium RBG_16_44_10 TaxID=1802597 RepID=A0A1G1WG15_9BACT|nr:MAG: hypothetical protein A2Z24_02175 [Candidatus Woykebacteria bacterium RBG_16_44_10]